MENLIYIFFIMQILASLGVILAKNPVQSILFLIIVFLITTNIFIIIGAEFLALFLLIIYIGAISVLFLFVIMMLNLRLVENYNTVLNYIPIGAFVGFIFFFQILFLIYFDFGLSNNFYEIIKIYEWVNLYNTKFNIILIGVVLYNHNSHLFLIAGFILFVAMIGSIILTHNLNIGLMEIKKIKTLETVYILKKYNLNLLIKNKKYA